MLKQKTNPVVRFFNNVKKQKSGCWEWLGAPNSKGYGSFTEITNKKWLAHRYSYFLKNKNHDTSLFVLHKCDNPKCVNPDHLFLGTQTDNMRDCVAKGRLNSFNGRKKECKNGHKFNEKNTYFDKLGMRHCRQCYNVWKKNYNLKRFGMTSRPRDWKTR
jgi:hypothetical protein